MKLEDQVCTPDQGEKLKELGIKQESLYYWTHSKWGIMPYASIDFSGDPTSVFTVAELGLMLPDYLRSIGNLEIGKCETDHVSMTPNKKSWWNVSYWAWVILETPKGDTYMKQRSEHIHQFPTLAQAMAEMLIYLIEKEFVTVEEINKKLSC